MQIALSLIGLAVIAILIGLGAQVAWSHIKPKTGKGRK